MHIYLRDRDQRGEERKKKLKNKLKCRKMCEEIDCDNEAVK